MITTNILCITFMISFLQYNGIDNTCISYDSCTVNFETGIVEFLNDYIKLKYKKNFKTYVYVSIKAQMLYYIKDNKLIKKYPVSTAIKGTGSEFGSEKTPLGLHIIKVKIGEGVPYAGIIKERKYTGKISKIYKEKKSFNTDDVTSRILWLEGMEPGINKGGNKDSYNRYIYIHGTPEEGLIGQPASHGCIRMKNKDIIELFDLVEINTPVLILNF